MLFMAGFAMLGDISPAAWPGKTLLVTWMRCCGQTETEERMQHSFFFFVFVFFTVLFYVTVYSKFFCFVCRPLYVKLCVGLEWDVHGVHCFCGKNKIYLLQCICVLSISTIFSNSFTTHLCTVCSKCNTEPKKRPKSL